MGLSGALQIGRSGLLTSQAALQVTGNNLANAATPGYHRQTPILAPTTDEQIGNGLYVGTGVRLADIQRQISVALESRLRGANADVAGSQAGQQLLTQIETTESSYSGSSLPDQLTTFFNQWSQLAANPQDTGQRNLVIQQGRTLANYVQGLRGSLTDVRTQTQNAVNADIGTVNSLLGQIAQLNGQIAGQGTPPPSLMDQRDQLLGQLSQYLDISTMQQSNGSTDVYVGSTPLILASTNRGVALDQKNVDGKTQDQLVVKADSTPLNVSSGSLGASMAFLQTDLPDAMDKLDTFAHQLIYQVNRIHSQSQGLTGITSATATNAVADPTAALDSTQADLAFTPVNGSFDISVTDPATGQRATSVIHVDLTHTGSDSTLNSLAADLNAVTGVNASVLPGGKLTISATGGATLNFSDDTSGILAALGINNYFTGKDATDIGVSASLAADPTKLAISRNFSPGGNAGALAMASLQTQPTDDLGGASLSDYWTGHVQTIASKLSQTKQQAQADGVVQANLQKQQQSFSGVNTNEQAINLMQNQQAFQASARFITTVDQMMQTLMQMI